MWDKSSTIELRINCQLVRYNLHLHSMMTFILTLEMTRVDISYVTHDTCFILFFFLIQTQEGEIR